MRWTNRPEGSNWGEFGADDQIGRLNLLTPQKVLEGIAEVRDGRSFCLSLPLDYPGGNVLNRLRRPPRHFAAERGEQANFNYPLGKDVPGATDLVSDDAVLLYTQYSTQWDALAHVGSHFDADGDGVAEGVYYNGYRAGEHVEGAALHHGHDAVEGVRAHALGIENMARTGVQGRAVMVDLERHLGRGRTLVGRDTLLDIMAADGVTVEPGDMLVLHTGFAGEVLAMGGEPDAERLHEACAALDGRDEGLHDWIRSSGISVIAADNYAVEHYPARTGEVPCAGLPLHELCLFKLGIHLGELWYLDELAASLREAGRSRFLLTAPPLRLPGSVGSPVTPVATI